MKKKFLIIIALIIIFIFIASKAVRSLDDYDCRDFKTQPEAQKVFDRKQTDIYDLDRNRDGIACSSLPKDAN